MKIIRIITSRFSIASDLLGFLWRNKLWWLLPIVIILLIVGLLVLFAQGTATAPFIYTIF